MTHWDAFCTIHWFVTGTALVCEGTTHYTDDLYEWYLTKIEE